MKTKKQFKVLTWDINKNSIEFYDIMPYLVREFEEEKKNKYKVFCDGKQPVSFEDYKHFVDRASRYQFWARCEYETIITSWPVSKKDYKLDVYEQITANLDIVTEIFIQNIKK